MINKTHLILLGSLFAIGILAGAYYLYFTAGQDQVDDKTSEQRELEDKTQSAIRAASEVEVVDPLDKVVPKVDPTDSVNPFKQNDDQYENPFE